MKIGDYRSPLLFGSPAKDQTARQLNGSEHHAVRVWHPPSTGKICLSPAGRRARRSSCPPGRCCGPGSRNLFILIYPPFNRASAPIFPHFVHITLPGSARRAQNESRRERTAAAQPGRTRRLPHRFTGAKQGNRNRVEAVRHCVYARVRSSGQARGRRRWVSVCGQSSDASGLADHQGYRIRLHRR
jgi:hypothetical protein